MQYKPAIALDHQIYLTQFERGSASRHPSEHYATDFRIQLLDGEAKRIN